MDSANLAICATPLSDLNLGENYQVQFAHTSHRWPNHFWWWWVEGEKDEIIRNAGKKGLYGLMNLSNQGKEVWTVELMSEPTNMVSVEMKDGAALKVVE